MRARICRFWLFWIAAVGLLLACKAATNLLPVQHPGAILSATPSPLAATAMPTQMATPSALRATSTPGTEAVQQADQFRVLLHPDGGLYAGDRVSFEVIAPENVEAHGWQAEVWLGAPGEHSLGSAEFGPYGIAGREQATLYWSWDTSGNDAGGYEAGEYPLSFSVLPQGTTWTQTVTLQPSQALPRPEPGARWAMTESECCLVYYITGTAAERDLGQLVEMVDEQAWLANRRLEADLEEPPAIVLLPRVLGHGGFTSDGISISYLDRNYASGSPEIVLRHEMVHLFDSRLGGELRPSLLVEGLAVYLSGGHFKPEALMPRAAALVELGWFIPLEDLASDFYPTQHEIGYLEAGALVQYMVERWGWQAFSDFYRDIQPPPDGSQAEAIGAALRVHFSVSLSGLEEDFLRTLSSEVVTPGYVEDVRLTVALYDTTRRYQQVLDPSAHFMVAWLPDGKQMRERGIVADYLRHPTAGENLALETLLVSAYIHLSSASYASTENVLNAANAVLEGVEGGRRDPFAAHALAQDYYAITALLTSDGLEPQRIEVEDNTARAWVVRIADESPGLEIVIVNLVKDREGWELGEQPDQGQVYNQENNELNGGVQ